jgi:hypothetical protein
MLHLTYIIYRSFSTPSLCLKFSKVLFNRLASSMPHIVGPHIRGALSARQLDNFQPVQSIHRKLHRFRRDAILFKLDITKAFNTVDWSFLLGVLAKLGFCTRWISMICGLLGTASTRVVVNGVAENLLYNRRGLRQGGPLSLLLFD